MKPSTISRFLGIAVLAGFLSSCEEAAPTSGRGMVLPPGNIEGGKTAFVELKCYLCHTVTGESFPEHAEAWGDPLELGGEVHLVKTYGELVTSITNPNHVISPKYKNRYDKNIARADSAMPVLIEEMNVRELIDLVTFLGSQYKKLRPDFEYPEHLYF